jgi:hypothetical protein
MTFNFAAMEKVAIEWKTINYGRSYEDLRRPTLVWAEVFSVNTSVLTNEKVEFDEKCLQEVGTGAENNLIRNSRISCYEVKHKMIKKN